MVRQATRGQNHWKWKGDKIGYEPLHKWLRKYFPRPDLCQDCNQNPPKHIANITGIYKRDFTNWRYICWRCHLIRDKGIDISNIAERKCSQCGSSKTYISRNRHGKPRLRWHYHRITGMLICGYCRLKNSRKRKKK